MNHSLHYMLLKALFNQVSNLVIMHADKIGVKKKQSFLMSPQVLT